MPLPLEPTSEEVSEFKKVMTALRGCGRVPLGILSYSVENQEFTVVRFPGTEVEELDALLKTIQMQVRKAKI